MNKQLGARFSPDGIMLRPKTYDECVKRRAAEMVLPELKKWMGNDLRPSDTDESLVNDLWKHMDEGDGYAIVKSMENSSWFGGNSELVGIMDGSHIYDAERELVKQWVKCTKLTLTIPIGTTVKWREKQGTVVKVDEELGLYSVHTPDLADNSYYNVNAEDVHPVSEGE